MIVYKEYYTTVLLVSTMFSPQISALSDEITRVGAYRKDKRATVNRFSVGFHMSGLTIVQTVGLSP